MGRKSKEQTLSEIHAEALEEFDRIQAEQSNERRQSLEDRRFYSIAGASWDGGLGEQFANKPRPEFNKTHLAVIRVINEYRNNRITVDFQPMDGTPDDPMADVCDGLYRADEQASSADEAHDNAFEEGVGGGFGAWRLRADYEDEEDEEDDRQRVRMEPIFDADSSVFFDVDAKRYDKADAKRCYVLTSMSREGYEEEYGDDPATWPKDVVTDNFEWWTPDVVYLCDLYCVEEVSETVRFFAGLTDAEPLRITDDEIEADESLLPRLHATGFRETRSKKVKRKRIRKYVMSGGKIIEDQGYIAGRMIPVIPFYGKRWYVGGIERYMGHVRLAKDAQRLHNALMSWLTTMAARFDVEKPIVTPEQMKGHAQQWADDNVSQFPYLLLNPMLDKDGNPMPSGPIGYTRAPNIPPAMAALTQLAEQGLQDLLGNQQAGEEMQPNISGKAIELIQNRLDMQSFIYMSNFAKSMKRAGEVWLSMMRDIAVEKGRKMKAIDINGQSSSVELNRPAYDAENGETYTENDFGAAKLEVAVDVGPSSSSKRAAAVRALTGMASIVQDPQTRAVVEMLALMNMEGEGVKDASDFFRQKLIRMGAIKPNEQEQKELEAEKANQQPDPQSLYLTKAAEAEEAKAAKSRADTVETIASADLKRAQTDKTISETAGEHQRQTISAVETVKNLQSPAPM